MTASTALPAGFKVLCSACAQSLDAKTQFSPKMLKKKHPRCRACSSSKLSNQATGGHQSKKESKWASYYHTLQNAGIIRGLEEQVRFELLPAQRDPNGKQLERPLAYDADFVYIDDLGVHVVDAKGFRTEVYRLKRKLMLYLRHIRIEEV